MKNLIKSVALLLLSIFILSCGSDNKVMVFNGEDLDNWNVFVSNPDELSGDLFWVEDDRVPGILPAKRGGGGVIFRPLQYCI